MPTKAKRKTTTRRKTTAKKPTSRKTSRSKAGLGSGTPKKKSTRRKSSTSKKILGIFGKPKKGSVVKKIGGAVARSGTGVLTFAGANMLSEKAPKLAKVVAPGLWLAALTGEIFTDESTQGGHYVCAGFQGVQVSSAILSAKQFLPEETAEKLGLAGVELSGLGAGPATDDAELPDAWFETLEDAGLDPAEIEAQIAESLAESGISGSTAYEYAREHATDEEIDMEIYD